MSKLNSNIPSFKALVKKSFFTKQESDKDFYNVYVFGIQSIAGEDNLTDLIGYLMLLKIHRNKQ